MIRKLYILSIILALLISCAKDGYVSRVEGDGEVMPITFDMSAGLQTRAVADLETIVKDFRVYGVNGSVNSSAWQTANKVLDSYVVWWNMNSANSSTTNSSDWEYVGGYVGATDDAMKSDLSDEAEAVAKQSVKYWDYDQPYHVFWGLAKAKYKFTAPFEDKEMKSTQTVAVADDGGITSATCLYYTNPIVVKRDNYNKAVAMNFYCAFSRVRFGFYEVVPGYAVKNVRFYNDDADAGCLVYGQFVESGSMSFAYNLDAENNLNHPTTTISYSGTPTSAESHSFGTLNYTYANDNKLQGQTESDKIYIDKLSSAPTYAGSPDSPGYYSYILPYQNNTQPLNLKCDYTLVSTDGGGHEMEITGATVTVPVEYCQWQPNHSYTYLFKITDSNLVPISFVGWSANSNTTDNQQGTITPLDSYSITTHQDGDTDEEGIRYTTGEKIDISVVYNGEDSKPTLVTLNGTTDYVKIYHQKTIREWIVETEISEATTPSAGVYREKLEPEGNPYVNGTQGKVSFIPDMIGTYRVEYHKKTGENDETLAVKIVKIFGEDISLDLYEKWQSGSSGEVTW